jgi:hypothetical protein
MKDPFINLSLTKGSFVTLGVRKGSFGTHAKGRTHNARPS